jgi:hypothetical protein
MNSTCVNSKHTWKNMYNCCTSDLLNSAVSYSYYMVSNVWAIVYNKFEIVWMEACGLIYDTMLARASKSQLFGI